MQGWTLDQLLWSERVMRVEFLHIASTEVRGPLGVVVVRVDGPLRGENLTQVGQFWRSVPDLWWVQRRDGWVLVTSVAEPHQRDVRAAFEDTIEPALVDPSLPAAWIGVDVAPTRQDVPSAVRRAERAARLASANPACHPLQPLSLAHLAVDDAAASDPEAPVAGRSRGTAGAGPICSRRWRRCTR